MFCEIQVPEDRQGEDDGVAGLSDLIPDKPNPDSVLSIERFHFKSFQTFSGVVVLLR